MLFYLLACTQEKEIPSTVEFVDPSQEGEHLVATKAVVMTNRIGQELDLQIWYPSENPSSQLHKYDDIQEGGAFNGGIPDCSEKRPVVLFSHGNQGMRYQSYFLTEYLTSHGFLVLAPDHEGNTFFNNDESRKPELIVRRPHDISDSFDWLLTSEDFQDCVDSEAGFAVIGHSFGGYTALSIAGAYIDTDMTEQFCSDYGGWLCEHVAEIANTDGAGVYDQTDDRVWATIPMAPAALETLIGGLSSVAVPSLVFAGSFDTATPPDTTVRPIYDELSQEAKNYVILEKAGHYSFSNACDLVDTYPDCGGDFMPPAEAHQLLNTTITAYLQQRRGMAGLEDYLPLADDRLVWE